MISQQVAASSKSQTDARPISLTLRERTADTGPRPMTCRTEGERGESLTKAVRGFGRTPMKVQIQEPGNESNHIKAYEDEQNTDGSQSAAGPGATGASRLNYMGTAGRDDRNL